VLHQLYIDGALVPPRHGIAKTTIIIEIAAWDNKVIFY
jgi:hypothetical protein